MVANYTHPGVYIREIPSGVRSIVGVSTSNTAFIGYFPRGPMNEATRITNFGQFQRQFGGLDANSEASYNVQQFFINGGSVAYVVRVHVNATAAGTTLRSTLASNGTRLMDIRAANEGAWGNNVQVAVEAGGVAGTFNLIVREAEVVGTKTIVHSQETHRNLTRTTMQSIVNNASDLIRVTNLPANGAATDTPAVTINQTVVPALENDANGQPSFVRLGVQYPFSNSANMAPSGSNGDAPGSTGWATNTAGAQAIVGSNANPSAKTGMFALEDIAPDVFNILCIPDAVVLHPTNGTPDDAQSIYSQANTFCEDNRAFLIVDLPSTTVRHDTIQTTFAALNGLRTDHNAVYFPRVEIPDPLDGNRPRNSTYSGTLAGVYAKTDAEQGVWIAPAGTDAQLRNANIPLSGKMTDGDNGAINPIAINALRTFPVYGNVAWGARTLAGSDANPNDYKYIPVRRTALYIEQSLYRGMQWVVFEPNDERLWSQIRANVGSFMDSLFRQGAFAGTSKRQAYFVKCDNETTTPTDVNNGVVNIVVGFAPLKPAEFVVIQIQQITAQEA